MRLVPGKRYVTLLSPLLMYFLLMRIRNRQAHRAPYSTIALSARHARGLARPEDLKHRPTVPGHQLLHLAAHMPPKRLSNPAAPPRQMRGCHLLAYRLAGRLCTSLASRHQAQALPLYLSHPTQLLHVATLHKAQSWPLCVRSWHCCVRSWHCCVRSWHFCVRSRPHYVRSCVTRVTRSSTRAGRAT